MKVRDFKKEKDKLDLAYRNLNRDIISEMINYLPKGKFLLFNCGKMEKLPYIPMLGSVIGIDSDHFMYVHSMNPSHSYLQYLRGCDYDSIKNVNDWKSLCSYLFDAPCKVRMSQQNYDTLINILTYMEKNFSYSEQTA